MSGLDEVQHADAQDYDYMDSFMDVKNQNKEKHRRNSQWRKKTAKKENLEKAKVELHQARMRCYWCFKIAGDPTVGWVCIHHDEPPQRVTMGNGQLGFVFPCCPTHPVIPVLPGKTGITKGQLKAAHTQGCCHGGHDFRDTNLVGGGNTENPFCLFKLIKV